MSIPALRRLARIVLWAAIAFHLGQLAYRLLSGSATAAGLSLLALAGLTTWLSLLPLVEARLDAELAAFMAQARAATVFTVQFEPVEAPRPVAPPRGPQVN